MSWRKPSRSRWRPTKRQKDHDDDDPDSGVEMTEFFRQALTLQPAEASTFNMDSKSDKARLAAALWSKQPLLGDTSLSAANGELAAVLQVLMRNQYRGGDDPDAYAKRSSFRIEGILSNLQRSQSQKQMPLITARLSVAAARCQLHGTMWRALSLLAPGMLASEKWTDDFIAEFARESRPPCEYEELKGVGGVMFDNYTRKVLYSSQATVEAGGYLLNMTNSASLTIPKMLAGPNFDANTLCAAAALAHAQLQLVQLTPLALSHYREEPTQTHSNGRLCESVSLLQSSDCEQQESPFHEFAARYGSGNSVRASSSAAWLESALDLSSSDVGRTSKLL